MLRRLARALIALPLLALLAAVASWLLPAGGNHAGTYRWQGDDPRFGGFSGLDLAADGRRFTAITDKGDWLTGTILRDGTRITGIEATPLQALRAADGGPLPIPQSDAEGLVLAPDGTAFISFEQRVGLRRYAAMDGLPEALPDAPFRTLPFNAGLESVALDGGDLLTIPEAPNGETFTLWRLTDRWRRDFRIARRGIFRISDATVFEGRLYVLERAFLGFGFSTRVRRFDMDGGGEWTMFTTRPGKFDNLEGLGVWRDGADTVITMLSDDNFMPFERTEFVEYRFAD
ncbi:esterase-like activity of phytase family protein [Falsirhodobacter algicola]|uniref:Esterase-like activity of phytase family protein n=1 Tax=Falsirhodobacter algicola TaxID=2692330 RepID=A0A8J8MSY1_9RHOB|nr:esterase-like activity of phytase family protein [Falsirhodobacter algicola]QUS36107.1 esterase-like activity of phytase family protein [Falsirhodobacter algicola]